MRIIKTAIIVLPAVLMAAARAPQTTALHSASTPATTRVTNKNRSSILQAVEAYRERFWNRGNVQWTARSKRGARQTIHNTSRFAGSEQLHIDRGDNTGFVGRDQLGDEIFDEMRFWYRANGDVWLTRGSTYSVSVMPARRGKKFAFRDVRTFDVSCRPQGHSNVRDALWDCGYESFGEIRYSESREGRYAVVRISYGREPTRSAERRIWVDAARGWSIVKSEAVENGVLMVRSITTSRQYGDVWFPERIARHFGGNNAGPPDEVITVDQAMWGAACPERLGPGDFGLEVGTNLCFGQTSSQPAKVLMWDGDKGVGQDEFSELLKHGKLTRGPGVMRAIASAPQGEMPIMHPILRKVFGEWDQRVDAFCNENALDAAQRVSANGILKQCKEAATAYSEGHRAEFDQYRRRLADQQNPARIKVATEQDALFAQERLLRGPLDDITEQNLKPRLSALMTESQRAARSGRESR